jgi:hypothetical protein
MKQSEKGIKPKKANISENLLKAKQIQLYSQGKAEHRFQS